MPDAASSAPHDPKLQQAQAHELTLLGLLIQTIGELARYASEHPDEDTSEIQVRANILLHAAALQAECFIEAYAHHASAMRLSESQMAEVTQHATQAIETMRAIERGEIDPREALRTPSAPQA